LDSRIYCTYLSGSKNTKPYSHKKDVELRLQSHGYLNNL
jgi:hypothetical protein